MDASKPDADADDIHLFDDLLAGEMAEIMGTRRWVDLADQIGLKEGMLRAYAKGNSDAGVNTLAPIMSWDLERNGVDVEAVASQLPRLAQLVFLKLVSQGLRLRQQAAIDAVAREAAKEAAREAARAQSAKELAA